MPVFVSTDLDIFFYNGFFVTDRPTAIRFLLSALKGESRAGESSTKKHTHTKQLLNNFVCC